MAPKSNNIDREIRNFQDRSAVRAGNRVSTIFASVTLIGVLGGVVWTVATATANAENKNTNQDHRLAKLEESQRQIHKKLDSIASTLQALPK